MVPKKDSVLNLLYCFLSVPLLSRSGSRNTTLSDNQSRNSRSPLSPPGPGANGSQEYELMTKQAPPPVQAPRRISDQFDDSSTDVWKRISAISPAVGTSDLPLTGEELVHVHPHEQPSPSTAPSPAAEPNSDQEDSFSEPERAHTDSSQQPDPAVEYEYMDIRSSLKATVYPESSSLEEGPGPADSVDGGEGLRRDGNNKDQEEESPKGEQEEVWVVQPRALRDGITTEPVEDYEEMGAAKGISNTVDEVEYQNMPRGGVMTKPGEITAGLEQYVKVRAGVGEQSNTSFDNPDYWHSRLFHKQDALRT